ncbi:MAG: matrixin family metalloprotease [Pirellulales bacterium]
MRRLLFHWSLNVALLLLAISLDSQPAVAFVASGGKWPQPGGQGTPVTITYSYQNMFDGALKMPNGQPLPATLIRESIEEAFGVWASYAPLTFVEAPDDGLAYSQGSTQFGQIRFRHVFINGPDPPPPAPPVAKARAYFPFAGGSIAGDVEFDHGDPWQQAGTLPVPDILGATIHELGHSLGLGHTSIPQANMYRIFTRYSGLGTGALHQDDINGIQFVYGAGQGGVIPLATVPEPATLALLLFTTICWFLQRASRASRAVLGPGPSRP